MLPPDEVKRRRQAIADLAAELASRGRDVSYHAMWLRVGRRDITIREDGFRWGYAGGAAGAAFVPAADIVHAADLVEKELGESLSRSSRRYRRVPGRSS
jgi:hypothetical protein